MRRASLFRLAAAALMLQGCFVFEDEAGDAAPGGAGGSQGAREEPCSAQADCLAHEACVPGTPSGCVGADCAATRHCAAPIGPTADLLPCESDAACRSGSCTADGTCAQPCGDLSACGPRFLCSATTTVGGDLLDACVADSATDDPRLCGRRDTEPCPAEERCVLSYDPDHAVDWSATCVADPGGLAADLLPCGDGSECHGGFCADDGCSAIVGCNEDVRGCVSVCLHDVDCAFPSWCQPTGAGLSRCEVDCFDRRSCPLGQVCGVEPTGAGPRAACIEVRALLATGAPCASDEACTSGLCVPGDAAGGKLCSAVCTVQQGPGSCEANGLGHLPCVEVPRADALPGHAVTACAFR